MTQLFNGKVWRGVTGPQVIGQRVIGPWGIGVPALLGVLGLILLSASPALADGLNGAAISNLQNDLLAAEARQQRNADTIWLLLCGGLVLMMQIDFLLLEAGAVRSKNSINVAQKNLGDLVISIAVFSLFGFSIMFGASQGGLFGWDKSHLITGFDDTWTYAFFAFQAMFVGTAATIVSGVVAERMTLRAYIMITVLIAAIIYPVFGHWAWGSLLISTNTAWLGDMGFMDFAGSTVVHATGGLMALVAIWMLGPRADKFDENGNPQHMHGHSMVLTTGGALVLFVGWLAFNGGSTSANGETLGAIITNTILAGVFGASVAMLVGRLRDGVFIPTRSVNGLLGGLVAVTAGADVVIPLGAIALGLCAGFLVVLAEDFIERKLKLDDVVGAVSVHAVCGIFGTVALPLFAPQDLLLTGNLFTQLAVQTLGVAINIVWVCAIAIPGIWLIKRTLGLRVSAQDEAIGLNAAEHGASMGTYALQAQLQAITEGQADLSTRLHDSTGDEAGDIAAILNPFLDRVQNLVGDVSHTSLRLANDLNDLSGSVNRSAKVVHATTQKVQATTQTVTNSAKVAHGQADLLSQESTHLATTANEVSNDIRKVADFVEQLSRAVASVATDAGQALAVSKEALELSRTAGQTVAQLGSAADEIESVVKLILGIQNQTNLLALNATIEAARAGEHGKGFGVVASEIKDLSERTAQATDGIRDAILKVRDTSLGSRDMIVQVGAILETINDAVGHIHTTAQRENGTVQAISQGVGVAASSVADLSKGVSVLDDHTGQVAVAINDATAQAHEAIIAVCDLRAQADGSLKVGKDVAQSSEEMSQVAQRLQASTGGLAG